MDLCYRPLLFVRLWTRRLLASAVYYGGGIKLYSRLSRDHAVVLMYHRVLDDTEAGDTVHPGMNVTREVFAKHLEYLSKNYCVVTLDQLHEWLLGRTDCPKTPCAITFDDGWEDNYRYAYPLLNKAGFPATIFLITNQIGQCGILTWGQVKEMESGGIAFGSHTATHTILEGRTDAEIRRELKESTQRLRAELVCPSEWFCYPKGQYDQIAYKIVKESYAGALTTRRGVVRRGDDPFQLRRIGIHNDVSKTIPLFACRLTALV